MRLPPVKGAVASRPPLTWPPPEEEAKSRRTVLPPVSGSRNHSNVSQSFPKREATGGECGVNEFAALVGTYFPELQFPTVYRGVPAQERVKGITLSPAGATEGDVMGLPAWIPTMRAASALLHGRELPPLRPLISPARSRGKASGAPSPKTTATSESTFRARAEPPVLDFGFLGLSRCAQLITTPARGEVPWLPQKVKKRMLQARVEQNMAAQELQDVPADEEDEVDEWGEEGGPLRVIKAKDEAYAVREDKGRNLRRAQKELVRLVNKAEGKGLRYLKYHATRVRLAGNEFRDLARLPRVLGIIAHGAPGCITSLDLSQNRLAEVPASVVACTALRCLYLQANCIGSFAGMAQLAQLPELRVLTIHGNPIEIDTQYKWKVLTAVPQLTRLDSSSITRHEREVLSYVLRRVASARPTDMQPLVPPLPMFNRERGSTPPTPPELREVLDEADTPAGDEARSDAEEAA